MAVFRGKDEKRVCAVKVLLILSSADAVRVAVGKKVLTRWVASVCEAFEQGCGFVDEIFASFEGLFDLDEVAGCVLGDGPCLGGVYHEDGKLELEIRILSLPGIGAVELESAFVGEEGCLVAWAEMRVVEDGTGWGGRGSADGVSGNRVGAPVGRVKRSGDGKKAGGGRGGGAVEKVIGVGVGVGVGVEGRVVLLRAGFQHDGGVKAVAARSLNSVMQSLRSLRSRRSQRRPPHLPAPRTKSRFDDKIKKRLSRYADISSPTALDPHPNLPSLSFALPPRAPSPGISFDAELDDLPRNPTASDDKKLLDEQNFDPDACAPLPPLVSLAPG